MKKSYVIKDEFSTQVFFDKLKEDEIRYVVLRWFEELPEVVDGGDIDILVCNNDLDKLKNYIELTTELDGRVKIDLYSVYGSSGTRYKGIPYYPPHFSDDVLDSGIFNKSNIRIPSDEMYFYSLAYHAAYQKRYSSGIPLRKGKNVKEKIKHDYLGKLNDLAKKSGIEFEPTIIGVHKILYEKGYFPGADALYKIGMKDSWIYEIFKVERKIAHHFPGFNLIVLRDKAGSGELYQKALDSITDGGYSVLFDHELNENEKQLATIYTRGGNWDNPGLFANHGGLPSRFIGVYDYNIMKPSEKLLQDHPGTDNKRIRLVKRDIRNALNYGLPAEQYTNYVHTSNGAIDAFSSLISVNRSLLEKVFSLIEDTRYKAME